MRALRIAILLAMVLAMATVTMAAGGHDLIQTPNLPHAAPGQLYDRTTIHRPNRDVPPAALPMPVDPAEFNSFKANAEFVGTPYDAKADTGASLGGSAIIAPRGSAMSTPMQRADREIDQLIRRLN